jgi:hypothetical protein
LLFLYIYVCQLLLVRPLGGRHAAVIPALPEEYDSALPIGSYFPHDRDRGMIKREDSSRRIPGPAEGSTSAPQLQPSPQHVQAGVTQIVLPPPTTSETLTIQEYQPPTPKEYKLKMSDSGSPQFPPSSSQPQPTRSYYRTRSDSGQSKSNSRSSSQSVPQPYQSNSNSSTSTPPPVPATFASIMNAYLIPPPGAAPEGKNSGSESAPTNADGSAASASD